MSKKPTPTLIAASQNTVGLTGNVAIVFNGTDLAAVNQLTFGKNGPSVLATNVQASQFTVTCPPMSAAGTVDLYLWVDGVIQTTAFTGLFAYSAPVVTALSVTSGPLGGGTQINITGQYLTGASAVLFDQDGNAMGAQTFQGISDILATATSPNTSASGAANVLVTVQGVTSAASPGSTFTYMSQPQVNSVSPNFGPVAGGTSVTVGGQNLSGATQVLFGSTPATAIGSNTATEIVVTAPAGSGTVDITVATPGGKSTANGLDRFQFGTDCFTIPLTIDATQAALPAGTQVYAYIVGEVLQSNGSNLYYRLDASGTPHAMTAADNTQAAGEAGSFAGDNYPSAWADYSIPVSLTAPTVINLAPINTTNISSLGTGLYAFSGRMYLSVGSAKLPFSPTTSGYTAPGVLVQAGKTGTVQAGAYTLFDWIEFSFDSEQNFNANTTQVDQFGLALTLAATPGGPIQGALVAGATRHSILADFGASGKVAAPFGNGALQVAAPQSAPAGTYPAGLAYLRLLSPKSITGGEYYTGPLMTYFDSLIAALYTQWQTIPLETSDPNTLVYTGKVSAQAANTPLAFYSGTSTTGTVAFMLTGASPATDVILSSDIWQCANTLASGNAAQLNVGKMIGAAFNRGNLSSKATSYSLTDTPQEAGYPKFYPSGATFNVWSQYFHTVSANQLAYGFPYDDVSSQNPSISVSSLASVTVTLGPL